MEQLSNSYSYLDRIRVNEGIERCKAIFGETCKRNKAEAANLLNDRQLSFPCLFILLPQIESLNLHSALNSRNTTALSIVSQISRPKEPNDSSQNLTAQGKQVQSILKWMLETGSAEDRLNDEYSEIIDIIVSVLINAYKDNSILPIVDDMIFKRHKKGRNIHTLAWAIFRIQDPYALRLIAEHLRSSDRQEVELACKLLNIKIPDNNCSAADCQKQYETYLRWLKENDAFLYFTDESFQYASEPASCEVDLSRKYICKGTPSYTRQPVTPSDSTENNCLQAFAPLSNAEKTMLSDYSFKIHSKDISEWKKWVNLPIDAQITIAKTGMEESI